MTREQNFGQLKGYGYIPQPPAPPSRQDWHGRVTAGEEIGGATFSETLSSMLGKANKLMTDPETLSIEAVSTGKVDIHEVMIALGKSEVAFKLISAITQKVVGGFEKLTSMQI